MFSRAGSDVTLLSYLLAVCGSESSLMLALTPAWTSRPTQHITRENLRIIHDPIRA